MSELEKAMDFNKTVKIPDPCERTRNDPQYLMSSNDVLKLIKSFYNNKYTWDNGDKVKPDSGKEIITKELTDVIIKSAKDLGWHDVKLIGKQLIFITTF